MDEITLSKRLETIAKLVDKDSIIQDVGSDHAYLPIYLCQAKIINKAIASEINTEPYLNSKENISKYNLEDKIKVVLKDGINDLDKSVDTLVIAGMGGVLIKNILKENKDALENVNTIITSPNNKSDRVREILYDFHYKIDDEVVVKENEKFYEIIKAKKTKQRFKYEKHHFEFGPILLKKRNEYFLEMWEKEKEKLNNILKQINNKNLESYKLIDEKIKFIEKWVI